MKGFTYRLFVLVALAGAVSPRTQLKTCFPCVKTKSRALTGSWQSQKSRSNERNKL